MKKILASILAITMLMTTLSACVIPASAENAVATGAFKEDFQNYGAGNWADGIDANDFVSGIDGMSDKTWTIYGTTNFNAEGAKPNIEVIAEPGNETNKVLKIDTDTMANKQWFRIRRNANGENPIKRTDLTGKKMVVKVKMYFPKNRSTMADVSSFTYDDEVKYTKGAYISNGTFGVHNGSISVPVMGGGADNYYGNTNFSVKMGAWNEYDKWHEFKYIVDLTGYKTEDHPADTIRGFRNGVIGTTDLGPNYGARALYDKDKNRVASVGDNGANLLAVDANLSDHRTMHSKFPQPSFTPDVAGEKIVEGLPAYDVVKDSALHALGDFYGTSMTFGQANVTNAVKYMYMDDIEVYYIEPFKQEGNIEIENNVNGAWYAGEIVIPFNNNLMAEVKEYYAHLDGVKDNSATNYPSGVTVDKILSSTTINNTFTGDTYKNLFTLKDAEGNVVENGIANAYVEGNKLVIEPSGAIDRNKEYTISASPLFMDEEGQGLNQFSKDQDIATFSAVKDPTAHIYIDENFDNYDSNVVGKNWAENRDDNGYVALPGLEKWMVGTNGSDIKKGIVKIVEDPNPTEGNNRGNVLMIDGANLAANTNVSVVRRPKDNGFVTRANMDGKRIVIEADIYIPASHNMDEETIFAYFANRGGSWSTNKRTRPNDDIMPYNSMTRTPFIIGQGSKYNSFDANRPQHTVGQWYTYRYVIDVSEQATVDRIDTVRGYIDGALIAAPVGEGKDESFATNANYPLREADGSNRITVDFWKRSTNPFGTDDASIKSRDAGDFYGLFMASRQKSTANTTGMAYYLDNIKAYYVEDLEMTTSDMANYVGGAINLKFNQEIPETFSLMQSDGAAWALKAKPDKSLAEMFTLKDSTGKVIENGFKTVKLSADKKTVILVPNVESNNNYTIEISRYFHDVEGQGITCNSTEKVLALTTGEITNFAMVGEVSRDNFSGFDTGRTVEFTATFNKAVTGEMIENGVVVKNTDTNEVVAYETGKWSYEFVADEDGNVDNKTIKLIFTYLDQANYVITTNEDFGYGDGDNLPGAFEVTISKPAGPIVLFDENFETGYAEGNWLVPENKSAALTSTSYGNYTIAAADGKGSWDIQLHGNPAEFTDFVGVVDAPKTVENGMSGKVLKISNSRSTTYSTAYTALRRNFDKDYKAFRFDEGEYEGKILVYEADMYGVNMTANATIMQPSIKKAEILTYAEGIWKATSTANGQISLSGGSYQNNFAGYGHARSFFRTNTTNGFAGKNNPTKVRMVIDQSGDMDTMRMYVGDEMHTLSPEHLNQLKGHAINDPYGNYDFGPAIETRSMAKANQAWNMNEAKNLSWGSNIGDNKGVYGVYTIASIDGNGSLTKPAVEIYLDNFKAYLVDAFDVEEVTGANNAFNTMKGTVTYTFSKKVDVTTAVANDTIVLLDAEGKEVAGGIDTIKSDDGDYKLIVKLKDDLAPEAKYTIKLKAGLKDTDGMSIRTQWYYYEYPIDEFYGDVKSVEGDKVYYNLTNIEGTALIAPALYTDRVKDANGKITSPATLTYYNADGTTSTGVVALDMYVKDEAKMGTKVDVVISKYKSLFAEATPATVNGNVVNTTVKITNPETKAQSVWCVVAVFGDYNEMLGCMPVNFASDEIAVDGNAINPGVTAEIPVSVDVTNGSAVKSVKLFVWDNYENMAPWHPASAVNFTK